MELLRRARHNVTPRHLLYVMFAVVAAVLLYSFNTTTFQTAFFNFCFGGIVPGTDIVLEPTIVLNVAAGLLGLLIVVPLTIGLVRLIRRRTGRRASARSAAEHAATPAVVSVSDDTTDRPSSGLPDEEVIVPLRAARPQTAVKTVPIAARRQAGSTRLAALLSSVKTALEKAWKAVVRRMGADGRQFEAALREIYAAVAARAPAIRNDVVRLVSDGARIVYALGVWLVFFAALVAIVAAGFIARAAIRTWTFVKPHLLRLDTWLELQTVRLVKTARHYAGRFESYRNLQAGLVSAAQSARQFVKSLRKVQ